MLVVMNAHSSPGSHKGFEGYVSCLDRYGFNAGLTAPGNLTKGYDSISQDFPTIVWRLKELGFNAIRLPFSFSHFLVSSLHIYPESCFDFPACVC